MHKRRAQGARRAARWLTKALQRRVERELERLQLDVHDGRVTLSDSVHSWAEHQAAIGAVRGTPGVRSIDDHLRVEP